MDGLFLRPASSLSVMGVARSVPLQIFLDESAGMIGLRFQHEYFHAMRSFGWFAQRKRICRDRAGRMNPGTFEQTADDHRLGGRSRRVGHDNALSRMMLGHGNFLASTIAPFCAEVHTEFGGIHRPMTADGRPFCPTQEEIDEESRRIRRLRILVHLTIESIAGGDLTPEEAAGMVAATRRVALEMFPGKERAFDLIYRPKFQRVMNAVYRLQ